MSVRNKKSKPIQHKLLACLLMAVILDFFKSKFDPQLHYFHGVHFLKKHNAQAKNLPGHRVNTNIQYVQKSNTQ